MPLSIIIIIICLNLKQIFSQKKGENVFECLLYGLFKATNLISEHNTLETGNVKFLFKSKNGVDTNKRKVAVVGLKLTVSVAVQTMAIDAYQMSGSYKKDELKGYCRCNTIISIAIGLGPLQGSALLGFLSIVLVDPVFIFANAREMVFQHFRHCPPPLKIVRLTVGYANFPLDSPSLGASFLLS